MVTILPPSAPWLQFSSFFFLMSAMWSDLILVRGCLILAYVNVLIFVLTGLPASGQWVGNLQELALDTLLWAAVNLLFHGIAFFRVFSDEINDKYAKLKTEDDKALFRMFNRTAGMHLLEFIQVRELGEWRRYKPGEVLTTHGQSLTRAFLVVEGVVEASLTKIGSTEPFKKLVYLSGHVFNLYIFNIFGVRIGFMDDTMHTVAQTDCLVFSWSLESLDVLANKRPPAVAIALRNFLLYEVCRNFNELEGHLVRDSEGQVEDTDALLDGRGRARDFRPWQAAEVESMKEANKHILKRAFMWFVQRFGPIPPRGIQHLVTVPSFGTKYVRQYMLALREALLSEPGTSQDDILACRRVAELHRQHQNAPAT